MKEQIKNRRVWKDEVTKLQYANAVFMERNSQLEKEKIELLTFQSELRNAFNILHSNVSSLLGDYYLSLLTKRGARFPKQLEENIKAVVQNYRELEAKDLNHKRR
jgi:hypothetical protein